MSSPLHALRTSCAVLAVALSSAALAAPAQPAAGTLSTSSKVLDFTTGPFTVTNYTWSAGADLCAPEPIFRCDDYTLTVDLPADYDVSHPDDFIRITTSWDNKGEDYDIYFLDAAGTDSGNTSSATGKDPEITELPAGKGQYTIIIRVVPFTASGGAPKTHVELVTPSTPPVETPPPVASGRPPQYAVYAAPLGFGDGAEPSIGYNPATKHAFYYGTGGGQVSPVGGQVLRVTFPENLVEPLPEACDADWADVTPPTLAAFDVDGILFTDQQTGRTFGSALLSVGPALVGAPGGLIGFNSIFAYTDDDGDTWLPGQFAPPQTTLPPGVVGTNVVDGLDHQTVGSGPWAAGTQPAGAYDSAVYYCSQGYIEAFCSRSDDGGATFPNVGVVVYTQAETGCGGLHGHVRVAPDGTVYLPNRNCNNHAAVAVSEDSGMHWEVRENPHSSSSDNDPQMALASDGTGYLCYVGNDGHVRVAVTKDKGKTWDHDTDIGYYQGIQSAVFPQAIAGDPDRAACAFLGSTTSGNYQAADFPGVFYPFVATTYDGGRSWHTVNVSPTDPVQREGGIWLRGGGETNRNLLDFNEITLDENGRPLFIYSDGCVDKCAIEGPNSFSAHATIARLVSGRSLFAANDLPAPIAPQGACLAGRRDEAASHLTWRVPGDNGASITAYRIYRGTSPDSLAPLTQTGASKASFDDPTADPSVENYTYQITAINSAGEGVFSNIVTLPVTPLPPVTTPCVLPGTLITGDPVDDSTSAGVPGTEIQSLSIAEPMELDGKLAFTIKVDSMPPEPGPGQRWVVYFNTATPPANGDDEYYVALSTDSGVPSFEYGTGAAVDDPSGSVAIHEYHKAGDLDAASAFSSDGTIVLVLDKTVFPSLAPGNALTNVSASMRSTIPGPAGGQGVTLDSTNAGGYTLRAANACIGGTPPLAVLLASVTTGTKPLSVTFNGGNSSDPEGDSIASYTFDFGDGSAPVTQASPQVTHVYTEHGTYPATLKVKNGHGVQSSNLARQLIAVTDPTTGGGGDGGGTHKGGGGALGLALLLPFGAALAWRRRRAAR